MAPAPRWYLHLRQPAAVLYRIAILLVDLCVIAYTVRLAGIYLLLVFFTMWQIMIHAAFFAVTTAASAYANTPTPNKTSDTLAQYSSLLLSATFTAAFGTSLIFWTVWSIDPALMLPPDMKMFTYHPLLNHCHHTLPFLTTMAEMSFFDHRPVNDRSSLVASLIAPSSYAALIVVALAYGALPYPFMQQMHAGILLAFLSALFAVAFIVNRTYNAVIALKHKSD